MNCERTRSLLGDYSAGLLSETRRTAVAAHLAQCAGCRGELARWERLDTLMAAEPTVGAEALVRTVMHEVRTSRRRLPAWLRLLDAGAAPLAVALLAGGVLFGFWQELSGLIPTAVMTQDVPAGLGALILAVAAGGVTAVVGWYVSRMAMEGA
jgi:anti-sigma factor RsiW